MSASGADPMAASFLKIDYALRPAKHTERRMLCDVFRRLSAFHPLPKFTYAGFGAIAFSDFVMFHKALGMHNMISMESKKSARPRVEANKPFGSIKIESKPASAVLPKLEWQNPHILWLDYDDPLTPEMLLDVATVATHANSGTALALSFQCVQAREVAAEKDAATTAFALFVNAFGAQKIPPTADESDLYGWKFGELGRRMLTSEIQSALAVRNQGVAEDEQIAFNEICSIEYSDDAKMSTVVGIFVAKKDAATLARCDFGSLDFLPTPAKPIRIDVPKLTLREIKQLERQLPLAAGGQLVCDTIPAKHAKAFAKLYRYLPNFAVLES